MMKSLLSATALSFALAASSFAADLPNIKAPIVLPPPPPAWTGFYAGLNLGGNIGTNSSITSNPFQSSSMVYNDTGQPNPAPPGYDQYFVTFIGGIANISSGNESQSGIIGGGQIGYNYQIGSQFVVGLETDFQGTSSRGHSLLSGSSFADTAPIIEPPPREAEYFTLGGLSQESVNASLNWLGTFRGRVGYLITPDLLAFVTGGLSYGGASVNNKFAAIQSTALQNELDVANVSAAGTQGYVGGGSKSQVLVGWNIGAGLEWKFLENWSLKAEALYWNLGSMTAPSQAFAGSSVVNMCPGECFENVIITSGFFFSPTKVNYQGVIVRAGVNYHFRWFDPGPVLAKY